MFRFTVSIFLVTLVSIGNLFAQDFPKTAVILEKANVTATRQLVLWMPNPMKNPRDVGEIYTCPEETRGHYYSGIAKVSLIDVQTKKVINTIEIAVQNAPGNEKNIDLPYLIRRGYYSVPKVDKNKEGKPIIMKLQDYNADGKLHEFAIFDAVACMGLETTLIGYSTKQDAVIQYEIELKTTDKTYHGMWADYLFGHKPNKQGIWQYKIDYRGRGGSLDKYEFRYDKKSEKFYGKLYSLFEE
jgi:hypothetical protein